MNMWPLYPNIYEINTWVWLEALSRKYKRTVKLATIPEQEWDSIASYGFDAVWFMGVWERSIVGREISMQNKGNLEGFQKALPDFTLKDNVGSPYSVHRYVVDKYLGGPNGLIVARKALAKRNIRLILDFVPNHVAPDHPWVTEHPEYFIQGNAENVKNDPASYIERGKSVFACGRDPYFPAWSDVLQINAFQSGLRKAVVDLISEIAEQCDGIRCDMAMLMLNKVFEGTWGEQAGVQPSEEYWEIVIPAIKLNWPEFKFIAEVYWDLEWKLQEQGFDFCYDKKLYDKIAHDDVEEIRLHLQAPLSHQQRMVRFIENHDESRAAVTFPEKKGLASALAILTLPGARLLHLGQLEGATVKLPVFLARHPIEPVNQEILSFYRRLLQETNRDLFRNGNWQLCERKGWPNNLSCQNILVWCWTKDEERFLIAINFSDKASQAIIIIPWNELRGRLWQLHDALSNEAYNRDGNDMLDKGLYIDLGPWEFHFFQLTAY